MSALLWVWGKIDSVYLRGTQWLMISMAVVIGYLVIRLKLEGTLLHKAQLAALSSRIDASVDLHDADVDKHIQEYNDAVDAYRKAAHGQ